MSSFNIRVKELRVSRKLSQQELANFLKISKSSVNMYERGEREPGLDTLENIADFFNVDMDYLMGKSDSPHSYFGTNIDQLTLEEQQLITIFRSLNEIGKKEALNRVDEMTNVDKYKKSSVSQQDVG